MSEPLEIRDLNVIGDYLLANHPAAANSLFGCLSERIHRVESEIGTGTKFQFLLSDVKPATLEADVGSDMLFLHIFTVDPEDNQRVIGTNTLWTMHRDTGVMADYTDQLPTLQ